MSPQITNHKSQTNPKLEIQNPKRFWSFGFCALVLFVICNLGFVILYPKEAHAGLIVQRPLYIGLTDGLVGHWTFDGADMAGVQAYDKSGNSNTGTLTNGPTRAIGRIGQALNFDGSNDFVNMGDTYDFNRTDTRTFTAWIKASGTLASGNNSNSIICKEDLASPFAGWCIDVVSSGKIRFSYINTYPTSDLQVTTTDVQVTAGNFIHVAVTYSGNSAPSGVTIYVNGVSKPITTNSDTLTSNIDSPKSLNIGNRDNDSNAGGLLVEFNGLIDDARIYNRVLSADEIKRLYNMGR